MFSESSDWDLLNGAKIAQISLRKKRPAGSRKGCAIFLSSYFKGEIFRNCPLHWFKNIWRNIQYFTLPWEKHSLYKHINSSRAPPAFSALCEGRGHWYQLHIENHSSVTALLQTTTALPADSIRQSRNRSKRSCEPISPQTTGSPRVGMRCAQLVCSSVAFGEKLLLCWPTCHEAHQTRNYWIHKTFDDIFVLDISCHVPHEVIFWHGEALSSP